MRRMSSMKLLCMVLVASALAVSTWADEGKIVFINLDETFNEFYKTKRADAQLKERADDYGAERRALMTEFEKLQASFNEAREEAQSSALSDAKRDQQRDEAEERLIELREQENRIRRFDQTRRKELDEQGRRMRNKLVEEILDVVRKYARDHGYRAVIDVSGQSLNAVEIVLYSDDTMDITGDIVSMINKDAASK